MVVRHLLSLALVATASAQVQLPSDWQQRDAEGRYALFLADYQQRADPALHEWVSVLAKEQEWRVLEWIATSISLGSAPAFDALLAADAPNWLRVAERRLRFVDSHGQDSGRTALQAHPALYVQWAGRHIEGLSPEGRDLLVQLQVPADEPGSEPPALVDDRKYDPPISRAEIFGPIHVGMRAVAFGERTTAEPGSVYVHQVTRAIAMLQSAVGHTERDAAALLAIVHRDQPPLAAQAALAFAHFPAQLLPLQELRDVADDVQVSESTRSASFLAATYASPYRTQPYLHAVALDPRHPHWTVAMTRLGELGDGYTVALLAGMTKHGLTIQQGEWLDTVRRTSAERDKGYEGMLGYAGPLMLAQAASHELHGGHFRPLPEGWVLGRLGELLEKQPDLRAALRILADGQWPPGAAAPERAAEALARDWAKLLLAR